MNYYILKTPHGCDYVDYQELVSDNPEESTQCMAPVNLHTPLVSTYFLVI